MKSLRNIGMIINVLGAVVTFGIMGSTTSPIGSLADLLFTLGFYAWVGLPFVVLIVLTFYIHRKGLSPAARVAILLTSILVAASSVLVYWASIFNSESSTSALVFVVIPFYALIAIAVVYLLAWLVLRLFTTKAKT
ncbi:MAG: hypothetical protein H7Z16_05910 [Pyrinomonadaceae bacterium]|nr:hypothetical protein [Pyrinomonadaceae bacterium]